MDGAGMTKPELTLAHDRTVPLPKLRRDSVDAAQHDLPARQLAAEEPYGPPARVGANVFRHTGTLGSSFWRS